VDCGYQVNEERFMDVAGAKDLEVRLLAGVLPGSLIEIVHADYRSGVRPGDVGTVVDATKAGVVVDWETGVSSVIDPKAVSYRPVK
jgi:hypothetical protein